MSKNSHSPISIFAIILGSIIIGFSIWFWLDNEKSYKGLNTLTEGRITGYTLGDKRFPVVKFQLDSSTAVLKDSLNSLERSNQLSEYNSTLTSIKLFKTQTISQVFIDSTISMVERTKIKTHVLYDSVNPSKASTYDSYQVWGIPLSIGIVGSFIFLFGIIFYRLEN
jgi:hypothetical protein